MLKKRVTALLLAVLACLALAACDGNPLPAGMDEETLIAKGRETARLLAGGEYEDVAALVREDLRDTITAESLQELMLRQTDGAGSYRQIEDAMATGQSSHGEEYGVAVVYCEYSEDSVLFRLAFDPDMALIGLEVKKQ